MDPRNRTWLLVLPLVIGLAVAGCDRSAPTDPDAAALAPIAASHAEQGDHLPMRARAGAVLLAQESAPDFGPPSFGRSHFGGRCSVPTDLVLRFGLEGESTHLGHFTGTLEHCTVFDWETGQASTYDGVLAFTAADGDELWGTYSGTPAAGGVDEAMVFTGGTGRFASASGGGIGHAECDPQAGTCVFTFDGTISYDASDSRWAGSARHEP